MKKANPNSESVDEVKEEEIPSLDFIPLEENNNEKEEKEEVLNAPVATEMALDAATGETRKRAG